MNKNQKPLEAVILDWAGTAVDYGCFAPVQAFAEVFNAWHLAPTLDEIRKPMGMLKWDHINTMLAMPNLSEAFRELYHRDYRKEDVDQMYAIFESKLMSILADYTQLKPHVLETVEELRERGIRIGSTTGYTDNMMEVVTACAKKQGYEPDAWFSPNSTGNMGRPYPYMIFKNMMELKLPAVDCVLKVGDTVSDILEGKNAGVLTAGIVEGSSEMGLSEEEYEALSAPEKEIRSAIVAKKYRAAGADYVFQDIRGVLTLI